MELNKSVCTTTIPKMDWKIELLGGENFISTPTVASRKPGGLDVFVCDKNNNLWYILRNGVEWVEWQNLGGPIYGTPSVVNHGKDNMYLDCFARDAEFNIIRKRRYKDTWSEWEKYPQNATAHEVVVSHRSENEFDMFLRGTKGTLDEVWYAYSLEDRLSFKDFRNIGIAFSPICGAASIEGTISCYALNEDKHVIRKRMSSNYISSWEVCWDKMAVSGAPAVALCGKNHHLFVCDESKNLFHIKGIDLSFLYIEDLNFKINHWPCAVSWGTDGDNLNCFVVGTNQKLYYIHY